MCLSTVYRGEKKPGNEILQNVMLIDAKDGEITLTDILGREAKVCGTIAHADLTGGYVIVKENPKQ